MRFLSEASVWSAEHSVTASDLEMLCNPQQSRRIRTIKLLLPPDDSFHLTEQIIQAAELSQAGPGWDQTAKAQRVTALPGRDCGSVLF